MSARNLMIYSCLQLDAGDNFCEISMKSIRVYCLFFLFAATEREKSLSNFARAIFTFRLVESVIVNRITVSGDRAEKFLFHFFNYILNTKNWSTYTTNNKATSGVDFRTFLFFSFSLSHSNSKQINPFDCFAVILSVCNISVEISFDVILLGFAPFACDMHKQYNKLRPKQLNISAEMPIY